MDCPPPLKSIFDPRKTLHTKHVQPSSVEHKMINCIRPLHKMNGSFRFSELDQLIHWRDQWTRKEWGFDHKFSLTFSPFILELESKWKLRISLCCDWYILQKFILCSTKSNRFGTCECKWMSRWLNLPFWVNYSFNNQSEFTNILNSNIL